MADPIQEIKDGSTVVPGQADNTPRSENRIKDLADKLKEKDSVHSLEKEEWEKEKSKLAQETREAKFELELTNQSSKYPHAKEFKDDIKSYAFEKGLSVEEATTLVLTKNNKLVTGQDIQRVRSDSNSFGGASVTIPTSGENDPARMTQDERRQKLNEMSTSDWQNALKGFNQ